MRRRLLSSTALGLAVIFGAPTAKEANAFCVLSGTAGNDPGILCANDDLLDGTNFSADNGDDTIIFDDVRMGFGGPGDVTISGASGVDTIAAISGTDIGILPGNGVTFLGQEGTDTFVFNNAQVSPGHFLASGGVENDHFTFADVLLAAGTAGSTIIGDEGSDSFVFTRGIVGDFGSVTIAGGIEVDPLAVNSFSFVDTILANRTAADVTVVGSSHVDTFGFINSTIGDQGNATVNGGGGNDIFTFTDGVHIGGDPLAGQGVVLGGSGNDQFIFVDNGMVDVENAVG